MNYKAIFGKFVKAFLTGGAVAVLSFDISGVQAKTLADFKHIGLVLGLAFLSGAFHAIWEAGRQYFNLPTESVPSSATYTQQPPTPPKI